MRAELSSHQPSLSSYLHLHSPDFQTTHTSLPTSHYCLFTILISDRHRKSELPLGGFSVSAIGIIVSGDVKSGRREQRESVSASVRLSEASPGRLGKVLQQGEQLELRPGMLAAWFCFSSIFKLAAAQASAKVLMTLFISISQRAEILLTAEYIQY